MNELPQMPVSPVFEPPVAPEPTQTAPSRSRTWMFLGALAVVVVALVGAVIWRLEVRRNEALRIVDQPLVETEVPIKDIEANEEKQNLPQAIRARPDEFISDLESIQDPILSDPCFVTGENTCQYSFNRNQLSGNDIRIQYTHLSKRQEKQDLFFLFSRMLVLRSVTSQTYNDSLLSGVEPQPYLKLIEASQQAGLENNINPALIYTIYELAYTSAQKLDIPSGDISRYISPQSVALILRQSLDDPTFMTQTLLGSEIIKKEWSTQSKALIYTLATFFHPSVAQDILAESGNLEKKYYELFSQSDLLGELTLNFDQKEIPMTNFFTQTESVSTSFDFAVCKNAKVYVCTKENTVASCNAFSFYDYYCPMLTNIP